MPKLVTSVFAELVRFADRRARSRRHPLAFALAGMALMLASGVSRAVDFLDPSEAFKAQAHLTDAHTIEVKFVIAKGYYLYRERFKFDIEGPNGPSTAGPPAATLGIANFPKGEIKFDETFNKNVEHFRNSVVAHIPVTASGPFTLVSTYQGCADAGLCYPPQTVRATLDPGQFSAAGGGSASPTKPALASALSGAPAIAAPPAGAVNAANTSIAAADKTNVAVPDSATDSDDEIVATLRSGNVLAIGALFLGLGLLLAFTPCVLPMLPILSSIIVGDADRPRHSERRLHRPIERMRGCALALAYSLGMALVYTGMGVAAGLAGEGLASALQTPAVLFTFAGLLVVLSLSMFGFYQLQMPGVVQSRLSHLSNRVGSGRFVGVFLMGALSSLIVGPCVAAPLAGALLYISQTHNVIVGGFALFCLAMGMCVPLILIGVSAGALLPRTGAWMESVKRFFGALLIGVAIWMVSPVIPVWLQMLLWALLLIVSSVYLRVFDPLPEGVRGWTRFGKGAGVVLFLCGALQLVGVAIGSHNVLQPLDSLVAQSGPAATPAREAVSFDRVHSLDELDRRIAAAGKPVMLDFYADWCVSCKEMERFTYTDPRVEARLAGFVLLQADVTANTEDDRALMKRYSLYGPPGIIFFDAHGGEVNAARIIGYNDAEAFLNKLRKVAS